MLTSISSIHVYAFEMQIKAIEKELDVQRPRAKALLRMVQEMKIMVRQVADVGTT
jgi:hypothetical protein